VSVAGLKRTAPDLEWVQMYRQGITTPKIAAIAGAAESTVRYHLAIAAKLEPSIRDEHRWAAIVPPRITAAGRRNLEEVLALYRAEGRLPTTSGPTARERRLGVWLHRRRQEAAQAVLSPIYMDALGAVPGWDTPSSKKADEEVRWKQRLAEVSDYSARGNDWPRHNKTDIKEERVLGVWLHGQRINHRKGALDAAKEAQLDAVVPGWRQGRARGRRRRRDSSQAPAPER
jgi:hypothetical protein